MSRKDLIKSRINIADSIKHDFATSLQRYLNLRKSQSIAPFRQQYVEVPKEEEPSKFKKSLVDWRNFYSQPKFKKSSRQKEGTLLGKQNISRPQSTSLSFAKSTFSNNHLKKQNVRNPSLSCRKMHSSFSGSDQKQKSQPFDPKLTPFVLVQNIYESNVSNFEETKRAQTARIRQYYERKAEKVEEFQLYDKLESKINTYRQKESDDKGVEFVRSGRQVSGKKKELLIYQRKSKRIIMPNQYFKDLNRAKISRKNVFKQYQVEVQH